MKSIAFFNNKGGVGKTTLACNLVSYLNMHKGKRVLLVDADPQCNATQAILDDDRCEAIYLSGTNPTKTLYHYLLRISAIVDACFRLIVDGVSAPSWTRRGCAQARG
ncbi:MAG: AAA family ATPase [Rhodoferax sp.]|nr:AAA family ATPase [Rhodoferax sp.]